MLHPPTRSRMPIAAAGVAVTLALALAPSAGAEPVDTLGAGKGCVPTITSKLVPSCGAWFGVGPNPYGSESYDQALLNFEAKIERTVDISHYYTTGQTTMFPTNTMLTRANEPGRERLLLVNWKPTGLTWRQVADGAADDYLADLADHIQDVHPEPFFLSIEAEPEDNVDPTKGSGDTAKDYADFFRHTVEELRANGATKVVTVMNYMGAPHWPDEAWFEDLYPGNDVVDWLAEDQYAFGEEPGVWLSDFGGMVNRHYEGEAWKGFYTWATENYPSKPIMLGEWGVSEEPAYPSYKPDFFDEMLGQLRADYPAIKALVYWDSDGDTMMGDTRPHSTPASLAAFNNMADSRWFVRPGEYYLDRTAVR